MKLDPILNEVEASIQSQLRLADPAIVEAAALFLEAFRPAVRVGLAQAVEQAAAEITAQLCDQQVHIRLVDGEPDLVLTKVECGPTPTDDDLEARITLRLPGALKSLIEDAANTSGESINGWVVDALRNGARKQTTGRHVRESFQL
ncbi:MAG TPA: DUF1778 domain-containing protein [Ilumatobacter sp.]|nr:DUF1778 domain-containing protein [Ilumatobacter sp.]